MERFKSLLQRLQEVYYGKHQKSAIDIDLMMDYTRVMYADLLEWRKEFTAPPHSDLDAAREAHKETHAVIANTANETPAAPVPESHVAEPPPTLAEPTPQQPETPAAEAPAPQAAAPVAETPEPAPEAPVAEAPAPAKPLMKLEPDAADLVEPTHTVQAVIAEEAAAAPAVKATFPEEESIEAISKEHTGISFEPPFHLEKPVVVADAIVEEAPSETPAIAAIPAPAPAEIPLPEFKPYEPAKLFDHIVERREIRSSIGINDKYLFLNELFNNHKSDYEETLDAINQMSTLNEAVDWMKTKVTAAKQWEAEDQTVQSFYALLGKHFSPK